MSDISQTIPAPGGGVVELKVKGMNCSNCVRHVTDALQSVRGVASAIVTLEGGRAAVRGQPGSVLNPTALIDAVKQAGYHATVRESADAGMAMEEKGHAHAGMWGINVLTGIIPTAVLMAGDWVLRLGEAAWWRWASLVLAGVVQFGPGRHFYRGAWNQLKAGSSNMDTLVALGSTTAFAFSTWVLLTGSAGHLYFMEAAAIITLISVGHWMEARVSARASSALRALMRLAPAQARRCHGDGTETEVPTSKLVVNDLVALRPGDLVPTDGEVVEGNSAVDESMLTGESMPVEKAAGTRLYAGTANLNGRLLMKVTSVGEETALAAIIAAVQRAQTSRADIQRLGDRVSAVFVPVVVVVAITAGLGWGFAPEEAQRWHEWLAPYLWAAHAPAPGAEAGFIIAAAVLIIACPCAMGLATPAAIMAGANAAVRRGILIRDGVALEKAGRVTTVLFDKTGTLTAGKPEVAEMEVLDGDRGEALRLAAALARHSTHPLSQAVNRAAAGAGPPSETVEWSEIRGSGIQGRLAGGSGAEPVVRLGSWRWLAESGVRAPKQSSFAERFSAEGATILGLSRGSDCVAFFAVKDRLKDGARAVIASLMRQGLRVCLVTGDRAATARSVGRQAGISEANVFAEVRPDEKAGFVRKLQEQGERVAFVGDGINDAPALEQADLGIAVSRASDVAREAADIVLLRSDIEAIPESIGLARATLRTIRQNLFWAFFYNSLGVPLAALGFMSPVLCAAAMGVSDLIVIGNALRLGWWKVR